MFSRTGCCTCVDGRRLSSWARPRCAQYWSGCYAESDCYPSPLVASRLCRLEEATRLPERSAIVAFSADEVYAIAELIRRQRGGAAVVLGALSPRTRNAQVEIYQSGDVDYLVATDAIGMGLNLGVDHVVFAQNRSDGYQYRPLTAAELGQVAGRAGRHTRDGTGVTGRVDPFDDELVEKLETAILSLCVSFSATGAV